MRVLILGALVSTRTKVSETRSSARLRSPQSPQLKRKTAEGYLEILEDLLLSY